MVGDTPSGTDHLAPCACSRMAARREEGEEKANPPAQPDRHHRATCSARPQGPPLPAQPRWGMQKLFEGHPRAEGRWEQRGRGALKLTAQHSACAACRATTEPKIPKRKNILKIQQGRSGAGAMQCRLQCTARAQLSSEKKNPEKSRKVKKRKNLPTSQLRLKAWRQPNMMHAKDTHLVSKSAAACARCLFTQAPRQLPRQPRPWRWPDHGTTSSRPG